MSLSLFPSVSTLRESLTGFGKQASTGLLNFFWREFLTSFCLRLPLPLLLLLILGVVLGEVGVNVGVPDLVYHEDRPKQFWAGVSVGLLVFEVLLIGFLLWNADKARRSLGRGLEGRCEQPQELLNQQGKSMTEGTEGVRRGNLERDESQADGPPGRSAAGSRSGWVGSIGCIVAILLGSLGVVHLRKDSALPLPGVEVVTGEMTRWASLALLAGGAVVLLASRCREVWAGQSKTDLAARWQAFRSSWPFFVYAVGILACFLIALSLVMGAFEAVARFADMLGLRDRLSDNSPPLPERAVDRLPFVAGVVNSVLLVWALLAVALSDWAAGLPRRIPKWLGKVGREAGERPDSSKWSDTKYHLFLTLLVALGAIWYMVVVAPLAVSYGWLLPFLIGMPLLLLLVLLVRWWFPGCWGMLRWTIAENVQMPDSRLYRYQAAALLMFLASVGYYIALSFSPVNSPLPTVCFFLFVLVSAYGLIDFAVYRMLPILLAGLALLIVFGGIPPMKFRFEGLPGDKVSFAEQTIQTDAPDADDEKVKKEKVLDLAWHVALEVRRQRQFDELMQKLATATGKERETIEKAAAALQSLAAGNRVRPLLHLGPGDVPESEKERNMLLLPSDLRIKPSKEGSSEREPLAIIAVSGGGLRSAVWTLRVLQELEKEFAVRGIDFPSRVRVICGASGGMLGAAYYIATLPDRQNRLKTIKVIKGLGHVTVSSLERTGRKPQRWDDMAAHVDRLSDDFLTPLLRRAIYNDFFSFFSPYPNLRDRGRALEEAWGKRLGDASCAFPEARDGSRRALDLTFEGMRERERTGDCPSLVFSPMMIEDGRRLLISNLDLRYVAANTGNRIQAGRHGGDTEIYSVEALELFRLFPEAKGRLKLSTAVRMSASFPYFSPAVAIPTSPRRRVVDAGYYDNYGVSLAASWLFSGRNYAPLLEPNASKVVLIQIRDALSDDERALRRVPKQGGGGVFGRSFEELSSPPRGALQGALRRGDVPE